METLQCSCLNMSNFITTVSTADLRAVGYYCGRYHCDNARELSYSTTNITNTTALLLLLLIDTIHIMHNYSILYTVCRAIG
jgi:hypothetical protein